MKVFVMHTNLVHRDYSKHTHTHTHKHCDYTKLTLHSFKQAANKTDATKCNFCLRRV